MKTYFKIARLSLLVIALLLSGCVMQMAPLKNAPAKDDSIGVMSFLGNDAILVYATRWTSKQDKYDMNEIDVDNRITDLVKRKMGVYGRNTVFTYHLPKDNGITTQSMQQASARLSSLTAWERKYIGQLTHDKHFDYLVVILPEIGDAGDRLESLYKYGIYYGNGSDVLIGFYVNYRIIIVDGKTLNIISQQSKIHFIERPQFKIDWEHNFPQLSDRQKAYYKQWLRMFVENTITDDALRALNLMQVN